MGISVKKEISIGQIVSITIFVMGIVGGAYALNTRVTDLESHMESKVEKEELGYMKDDIKSMSQDIREIRNVLFEQIGKQANTAPTSSRREFGQSNLSRESSNRSPNFNYPDSSNNGGAR